MSDEALVDFEAEDIDIDDAISLVHEAVTEKGPTLSNAEDWISCSDSAIVFRDHVVIEGDLSFPYDTYNGVAVIFEKGLAVSGLIEDCGGEDSVVIVLGDLDARDIACTTHWLISGDVKIEGTAFGFGTGDYELEFDGDASCELAVTSGYSFDLNAKRTVDAEADPTLVHDACLEDDEIVVSKVIERLRNGLSILA